MTMIKPLLWMLLFIVSCPHPVAAASQADLSDYRWKHRLLFIFAPSAGHARYLALHEQLAQAAPEIEDRDLLVFRIIEDGPSLLGDKPLPPGDAEAFRRRFEAAPGKFTVVLVGKDGGVKLVKHHAVDLQSIFNRIDSMPMRRQEMREKGSEG
jgi:hypothetical protein